MLIREARELRSRYEEAPYCDDVYIGAQEDVSYQTREERYRPERPSCGCHCHPKPECHHHHECEEELNNQESQEGNYHCHCEEEQEEKGHHHGMKLAMAYVLKQQWHGKHEVYSMDRALLKGSIFKDLDLPFKGKGGCDCE